MSSDQYYAGVRSVTLCDPVITSFTDLASQFYCKESDVGVRSRAAACVDALKELNPYVTVTLFESNVSDELLLQHNVVVLVSQSSETIERVCALAHAHNIAVIVGDVKGVCGQVFCDFGESFVCQDVNGEVAASSMIAHINTQHTRTVTEKFPGGAQQTHTQYATLITTLEETPHNLETGDVCVLSDIVTPGSDLAAHLNNKQFRVVKKDLTNFEIDIDLSSISTAAAGASSSSSGGIPHQTYTGYVNQVKQPQTLTFASYANALETPVFNCDVMKMDRAPLLHAAWR